MPATNTCQALLGLIREELSEFITSKVEPHKHVCVHNKPNKKQKKKKHLTADILRRGISLAPLYSLETVML